VRTLHSDSWLDGCYSSVILKSVRSLHSCLPTRLVKILQLGIWDQSDPFAQKNRP